MLLIYLLYAIVSIYQLLI